MSEINSYGGVSHFANSCYRRGVDQLRSFENLEQPQLRYLAPSFRQSYAHALENRRRKPVAVCYSGNGERIEKDALDFNDDVCFARHSLQKSEAIVVTIAGNCYEHLVYITACFLENKTLCPMNPQDGEAALQKKLAQLGTPATVLRRQEMLLGEAPIETFNETSELNRPMVLMFTSGSTGVSKIVEQDELAILSNVDALIERHHLQRPTVIATPLPIFHVNALEFSFLATLLSGNTFVLFENFHPQQIVESIARDRIDILSVVPHLLKILFQRCRHGELSRLLYITTAAAPLGATLAAQLAKHFPVRVLQGYGLSEAVNFSTMMPSDLTEDEYQRWMTNGVPPIGTELHGNSLHILDDQACELRVGEIGEICVRGWNVMRGYRGEDNRDVFRDGFLHTGDLGFFKTDEQNRKFFFVTGRKKDVIKRNAVTIGLADIDQLLAQIQLDAIAVGFTHEIAGEELAIVLQSADTPDSATTKKIEAFLQQNLPPHQRPRVLAWTSTSIRTASGKPQRWRLSPGLNFLGSTLLTDDLHIVETELSL
jgi:acyl-CoA synthetase (AMP-forming)/AMP-acid ligase II